MEKVKRFFISFNENFDRLNNVLHFISGVIVLLVSAMVIYEVIMRYIVNRPTSWVSEVSESLLVYIGFLSAAWVLREGGHIKVDILLLLLTEKKKLFLELMQDLFSIFFLVIFLWVSWGTFWESLITQEKTAGGIFSYPLWTVFIMIPFGGLLLLIEVIRMGIRHFIYYRNLS